MLKNNFFPHSQVRTWESAWTNQRDNGIGNWGNWETVWEILNFKYRKKIEEITCQLQKNLKNILEDLRKQSEKLKLEREKVEAEKRREEKRLKSEVEKQRWQAKAKELEQAEELADSLQDDKKTLEPDPVTALVRAVRVTKIKKDRKIIIVQKPTSASDDSASASSAERIRKF